MGKRFDAAFEHLLKWEGGFVDDPDDPGGRTIYGVSERAHPELWVGGRPTKNQAKRLYISKYWDACRCDRFPSAIGLMLFDFAVNAGNSRAIRVLQHSMGATEDGIVGPRTIEAVRACESPLFEFTAARLAYYGRLGSDYDKFQLGWARRTLDTYDTARAMRA